VIRDGDIQVMSAGTGVEHSEYNQNPDQTVKFLQIWLFPNRKNMTPRYDQITLNKADRKNRFQQILSPSADDAGVWIHQNAWFSLADFDAAQRQNYRLNDPKNGVYVFVINGRLEVDGQLLEARDGYGLWNGTSIDITATSRSEFLVMEVPMEL
jgi:redox-sensitive bicupin YhaK (pirin superfamily)